MAEIKKTMGVERPPRAARKPPATPPIKPNKTLKIDQIETVSYEILHRDRFDTDVNYLIGEGFDFYSDVHISSDGKRLTVIMKKDVEV